MSLLLFWNQPPDQPQSIEIQGTVISFTIPLPSIIQNLGLTLFGQIGTPRFSQSDLTELPYGSPPSVLRRWEERQRKIKVEIAPLSSISAVVGAPAFEIDDSLERDLEEFLTLLL